MKFNLLKQLDRENSERGTRGSYGARAPCSSSSPGPQEQEKKKGRRRRGKGRGKKRRSGQRKNQSKSERLAKSNMRILYWNCGSLNVRKAEAEKLACTADIVCLQETQQHIIKPLDFQPPICNNLGHGQLICVRKGIRFKPLELSQWTNDSLHLCGVELIDQPVRNIVNVYACNRTKKEENWMVLDAIQSKLPGDVIFCGDFNARGSLWGNTILNPQGEALEDALDKSNVTCINNGSMTRQASRPGDSDSAIDLTITSLSIAPRCKWQTLGKHSNDHYPCTVWIKRKKCRRS